MDSLGLSSILRANVCLTSLALCTSQGMALNVSPFGTVYVVHVETHYSCIHSCAGHLVQSYKLANYYKHYEHVNKHGNTKKCKHQQ